MKKVFYSICTLALLALSACTNDNVVEQSTSEQKAITGRPMTIEVGRGDAGTKIGISEKMKLTWVEGDTISVVFKNSDSESVIEQFALVSGAGTTKAIFKNENSVLPEMSDDKTVEANIYYPKRTLSGRSILINPELRTQEGTRDKLGQYLLMSGEAKVKDRKMSDCELSPDYVVLKLASGKQLFDSSTISSITKVVAEDLNHTIYNGVDGYTVTINGTFGVSGGKLQDDVYIAMEDNLNLKEVTPNIRVTVTADDGKDYTYVVTRSKEFYSGNIYSLPITVDSQYITFEDKNVEAVCVANWGAEGASKLTYAEAAAVTSLDERFYKNTTITSFNELQYFTGLISISANAFNGCSNLKSITLPSSVTSIGTKAFAYCSSLTSVTLPDELASIGAQAFYKCTGLLGIELSRDLTTIGNGAFAGCENLGSVTMYYGLTSIGNNAFNGCTGLLSITLPGSVTSIGDGAFEGCTNLTEVTCKPTTPPTLGSAVFSNCTNLANIYVPKAAVSDYQGATNWSSYKNKIKAME